MTRIRWQSRKTFGILLGVLILYFTIRVRKYEHKTSVSLNVHPNEAWEFVADFSNMKYLNPTITDFVITEESGNYKHWKYTTEYVEKLSHWPYLPNYSTAHFEIKATTNMDKYFINSYHRTCMFNGLYCLDSESEFKFEKSNHTKGAVCTETVIYQCPAMVSSFCRREVEYQREAIMSNLKDKFNSLYYN